MVEPLSLEEEVLSAAISAIRQRRGLSRHQAARQMDLALSSYNRFERRPAQYRHLRAFAEAADCDLFALLLSARLGSSDLAIRCADNKAARIALGWVENLFAEHGGDVLEALKPSALLGALEKVRVEPVKAAPRGEDQTTTPPHLTPRQIECLSWAQGGKSSSDIGVILGLSSRTIDEHVRDACARLGVRTRVQAIMRAVALGYLAP